MCKVLSRKMSDYFKIGSRGKVSFQCEKSFDEKSRTDVTYGSYILNCMLQDRFLRMHFEWSKYKTSKIPYDIVSKHLGQEWILTGSIAEQLNVPVYIENTKQPTETLETGFYISDQDIMMCLFLWGPVLSPDDTDYIGKRVGILKCLSETHPGYCVVELQAENCPKAILDDYTQLFGGSMYFDGEKFMSNFASNVNKVFNTERQGPALVVGKEYDHKFRDQVFCLPCCTWPCVASSFLSRKRQQNWPPKGIIQPIIDSGCHIVKVAHSKSIHKDLEFRYSFSAGEKILAETLTLQQKRVYIILKILHNIHLKENTFLSTYHLKTMLFWTLEETQNTDLWKPCNTILAINSLLDKLIQAVKIGNLPNFFIPENNMISHITQSEMNSTLQKLARLRNNHLQLIMEFIQEYTFVMIEGHQLIAPPKEEIKIWASMKYRQPNDNDTEIVRTNLHRCSLHLALAWLVEITADARAQGIRKLEGIAAGAYGCVIEAVKCGYEQKEMTKVGGRNKENFKEFFMTEFATTVREFAGSQAETKAGKVNIPDIFKEVVTYARANNFEIQQ